MRADTDIAFITIMAPDRTRFTHTDPARIGRKFVSTIGPALAGRVFTETYTGTLGPSIRAVAPVRASDGRIVGLVSAGITLSGLVDRWLGQLPMIAVVTVIALLLSVAGTWAVRRRLLRQTRGLRPEELRVMYEHHDAVLHAVREGLIVIDDGRVALVNDRPAACSTSATARSRPIPFPTSPARQANCVTCCTSPATGSSWSTDRGSPATVVRRAR